MFHRRSSRIPCSSGAFLVIALALSGCGGPSTGSSTLSSAQRPAPTQLAETSTPPVSPPPARATANETSTSTAENRDEASSTCAPLTSQPQELYAHVQLPEWGTREGGPFAWTPRSDVSVTLVAKAAEGTWDTGQEDRPGVELQIRILGIHLGSPTNGTALLEDRFQLAVSARFDMENVHVRALQRADGTALIAYDTYMLDMDTRELETTPSHTRRALLRWNEETSRPIVASDWEGDPDQAPAWARY